jgi:hypothetical protein
MNRVRRLVGWLFLPRGLMSIAVLIASLYFMATFAGGREYCGVFSGTSPTATAITPGDVAIAVAYVGLYLLTVLLVPILLIAAGLLAMARRRWPPR